MLCERAPRSGGLCLSLLGRWSHPFCAFIMVSCAAKNACRPAARRSGAKHVQLAVAGELGNSDLRAGSLSRWATIEMGEPSNSGLGTDWTDAITAVGVQI